MEQDFGSECSSGCESGWTFYLGHSMYASESHQRSKSGDDFIYRNDGYEEDDDMSMVSDASSGPPLVQEQQQQQQEQECCNNNNNGVAGWCFCGERQKIVKEPSLHRKIQDLPCFLDDTASSPFFDFSGNNSMVANDEALMEEGSNSIVDYSQGYSTTYFEMV